MVTKSAAASRVDKNNKKNLYYVKFDRENRCSTRLVKYEALPEYLQDNEYIRDFYRCEWPLKDIVFSIFSWHNETINIWTHLVGFVMFGGLAVVSLMETEIVGSMMARLSLIRTVVDGPLMMMFVKNTDVSDILFPISYPRQISKPPPSLLQVNGEYDAVPKWPWFIFLVGAMCCLVFSTLSHTFACHSKHFNFFFWRLDYAGIAIMIICSFIGPVYYAFPCHPCWLLVYLTSITLIGACVVFTLLAPSLSTRQYRSFRAKLFLVMGFSGAIPAAHGVFLYMHHPKVLVALGYEIIMGLLYAAGATFYVTRIPEKWKPGAYDIVGHSHQIFHIFVVVAALVHSFATLILMDWRQGLQPCGSLN